MADFTIEELGKPTGSFSTGSIFDTAKVQKREEDNWIKQSESSFAEKYDAFNKQAAKVNTVAKVANFAYEELYVANNTPEDINFNIDDESTMFAMEQNGVPISKFADIRQSKSQAEMDIRLAWAMVDSDTDKEIEETLTDNQRIGASVTGAVADIDVLAGVGIGALYSKATSLMKIASMEGAVEAGLATLHYATDEDYSVSDGLADFALGTMLAVGGTKLMRDLSKDIEFGNIHKDEAIGDIISDSYKVNRANFFVKQKGIEDEVKIAETATKRRSEFFVKQDEIVKQAEIEKVAKTVEDLNFEIDASKQIVTKTEDRITFLRNRLSNGRKYSKGYARKMRKELDLKAKELDDNRKILSDFEGRLSVSLDGTVTTRIDNINRMLEDMVEPIVRDIRADIDLFKIHVKDLKGNTVREVEDFKADTADMLNVIKTSNPKEYKAINSMIDNIKHGRTPLSLHNISNKKKAAIMALLGTTGAFAGEDTNAEEIMIGFVTLVAIATFSPNIMSALKNNSIKQLVTKYSNKVAVGATKIGLEDSQQGRSFAKARKDLADVAHTRFTSTVAPFQKYSKESADFIEKLLFSYKNGGGAEVDKTMWNHSAIDAYNTAETNAYKLWRTENKLGDTWFLDAKSKVKFRKEVTRAMENRDLDMSDAMKDMIKANDELLEQTYARAKEYGVFGFEKITYTKGKVPRLWHGAKMNDLLNNISAEDVVKIRDSIALAISKTSGKVEDAVQKADKFISGWKKGGDNAINSRTADIYSSLIKQDILPEGMTLDEFANKMNVTKDKSARAKSRIDFNVEDISDIKVNYKGVDTTIGTDFMVERDFKNIFDKVTTQINSSSALAKNWFTTVEEVNKAIENIFAGSQKLKKEAYQILDILTGKPLDIPNATIHNISLVGKDIISIVKLPLVAFSMPPEMLYTLTNAGFTKSLSVGMRAIKGRKDNFLNQLMTISGLGSGTNRIDLTGFQGATDGIDALEDIDIAGTIRNGTMRLRDMSMLANGLAPLSDLFQRMNLMANAEHFQDIVKGKKTINTARMDMFGIDADTIKMFDDDWDMSKWSMKKRDKFGNIMRDMNQQYTPETTLGETALGARTSDIGRLFSALLTYPMQQFNVHGLGDVRAVDKITLMHTSLSFAGAYMGLHARYAIQNKEVEEERIVQLALLNMQEFI